MKGLSRHFCSPAATVFALTLISAQLQRQWKHKIWFSTLLYNKECFIIWTNLLWPYTEFTGSTKGFAHIKLHRQHNMLFLLKQRFPNNLFTGKINMCSLAITLSNLKYTNAFAAWSYPCSRAPTQIDHLTPTIYMHAGVCVCRRNYNCCPFIISVLRRKSNTCICISCNLMKL